MFEKEKQSEKRQERLLAKVFSRSSFRSSFESAIIERASSTKWAFSITASNTNERQFQRLVREKSTEELINEYVNQMFNIYLKHNIQDIDLWNVIYHDFFDFDEKYWDLMSSDLWKLVHKMCYTQKFWIDRIDDRNNIRSKCMNIAIHREYYDDWSLEQIKWVKKYFKKLFSIV
jgi:hypothetical protein